MCMADKFPQSLPEFQKMFPDDAACALATLVRHDWYERAVWAIRPWWSRAWRWVVGRKP